MLNTCITTQNDMGGNNLYTSQGAGQTLPVNSGKLLVCRSWFRASFQSSCHKQTDQCKGGNFTETVTDWQFTEQTDNSPWRLDRSTLGWCYWVDIHHVTDRKVRRSPYTCTNNPGIIYTERYATVYTLVTRVLTFVTSIYLCNELLPV